MVTDERRRRIVVAMGALFGAVVLAAVVWRVITPSYDQIVQDCAVALSNRAEGDYDKPDACKGVKRDDYDTLVIGQVIEDSGLLNDDGTLDTSKIGEDSP